MATAKKSKNNKETLIIKENTHNVFTYLLTFITRLLGSIYNNLLIYIIIFLLFIIAFGTIFVKIPLDFLLQYLYLPEFLQTIIGLFQNNEIVNTSEIVAKVNTDSLEDTIKNMAFVQNSMISLLEKQSETITALQKSVERLSVQQNTTVGLNSVVDQLQVTNSLTQELININKATANLYKATHNSTMVHFGTFEKNLSIILNSIQKDLVSTLDINHTEYITCLKNNNLVLKTIQEHTINAFALNQNVLASINASTEMQQAGFEALLQSSTNNQEYLTILQDHQYLVDGKLQQISKENMESAVKLKENIKEIEKSTALGFIKDKMSNYDIEVSKTNKDNHK